MKAGFVLDQGEDADEWTSLLTPEVRLLCGVILLELLVMLAAGWLIGRRTAAPSMNY